MNTYRLVPPNPATLLSESSPGSLNSVSASLPGIFVRKAGVATLCLFLSGCAGLHTYNQARDTSTRQILTNFNKINLTGFINQARTNLEVLRQERFSAAKQSLLLECDFGMLSVLESPTNLFHASGNQLTNRIQILSGRTKLTPETLLDLTKTFDNLPSLRKVAGDVDESVSEIVAITQKAPPEFDWTNLPPPTPSRELTNGLSGKQIDDLLVWYSQLVDSCGVALDALKQLNEAFSRGSGESIRQSLSDWRSAMADVTRARKEATDAETNLNNVIDRYTQRAQSTPSFWKTDYTNAIHDVQAAIAVLKSTNALGANKAVSAKLSAVDILLQAVASGKASSAPTNDILRAAIVSASIPKLAEDIQSSAQAFRAPRLSSLMIEKELLSIEKDFRSRQAERLQTKADLSFQAVVMKGDELNDYSLVLKYANHSMGTGSTNKSSPFLQPMAHFL